MKIIPAIDLIEGKTVRLEQGKYDRKLSYDVSPVDAAKEWEAKGAELIHVVDLDGAREGRPVNLSVVSEISGAVNIPVEVGGGYRNIEDIKEALNSGVTRVVVGSKVLEDMDFARTCLEEFKEHVMFSVDAESFDLKVQGWEQDVDLDLFKVLKRFVELGTREIIYTDICKDGMLSGPSVDNIKRILDEINIKIISAGGVKTIDHIRQLKELEGDGLSGVIVGRALYEGTLDLKEAIDVGKENNPVS